MPIAYAHLLHQRQDTRIDKKRKSQHKDKMATTLTSSPTTQKTTTSDSIASNDQHPSIMEYILANDLVSRANYCYTLFAVFGFVASIFLYCSFVKSYKGARRNWTWMDTILCTFSICEFYIILISISSLAHRPKYMEATNLGCAVLGFFFNVASLNGQLHQVLMLLFLAFPQDSSIPIHLQKVLDKPTACVAGISITSLLFSTILAALRGPHSHLYDEQKCQLDTSPSAAYEYSTAKLVINFVLPNIIAVFLLAIGKRSDRSFLLSLKNKAVFPAVVLVTFLSRLFYNIVLMRTATLLVTPANELAPWPEAMMSMAEFVLFSGSSVNLVLVLWLHDPCWQTLRGAVGYLRDCLTGREARSHVMSPQIQFTEALDLD